MKQLSATHPQVSAYVDASAGSGKTKLLVDRIIRMLLYGVQPSKILCITFTNAAANEMNERLKHRLLSFLTVNENDLKDILLDLNGYIPNELMLQTARNLFLKFVSDSPKIQTLHGFCSRILQRMHVIDLNDNVVNDTTKIIDDNEKLELLNESFHKTITNDEIHSSLQTLLKQYDINYIFDLICEFWSGIASSNNSSFFSLLESELKTSEVILMLKMKVYNFCEVSWKLSEKNLIDSYIEQLNMNLLAETATVLDSAENVTSKDAAKAIRSFLQDSSKFENYVLVLLTTDYKPRARLPLNAKMTEEFEHLKEFLLNEQSKLCELMQLIHDMESAETNAAFNIVAWATLRDFTLKKKSRTLFEYSDLIRHTTNLIEKSDDRMALLYSIDMTVDHIMIDEAQDLSEMQWQMIQTITEEFFAGIGLTNKERTIFIVGDFKQAIFGFQGSAPKIFQSVKEFYRNRITSIGMEWHEIEMNTCYRCAPEILAVADRVCNGVKYAFNTEQNIIHHSIHEAGYGLVQIHEIEEETIKNEKLSWHLPIGNDIVTEKNSEWQVAQRIASTVHEWLVSGRKIGKEKRAIKPQDIMILLKKRSKLQDYLVTELQNLFIPVSNLASKAFEHSIVIYELMSAIRFVLQPFDDMNLVALLKSSPFHFSNDKITEICVHREASVWEVCNYMPVLQNILDNSRKMNIQSFVQWYLKEIYQVTNSETVKFMDYVFSYCKSENPPKVSLQGFLLWLHEFLSQKQQTVYDNSSVRITTVHSAKGLEAPIVILADAHLSSNAVFTRFAYEDDMFVLNTSNSSRACKALVERYNQKLEMENMRLLYVAMTRPKNELHVFGTNHNKNTWFSRIKSMNIEEF